MTLEAADGTASSPASRRGRPRSEQARLNILEATSALLLEHGLAEASMDEVAERAGVSKATIYRWWPTKELLALDALYRSWAEPDECPDTGSLRGDLLTLLLPWVGHVRDQPYGRVIAAFVTEAQTDATFGEQYRARFVEPRRRQGRDAFARAVARLEIPAGTDVDVALDLLYGSLYHRLLHRHAPLSEHLVVQVVDMVLRGVTRDRPGQAGIAT